VITTLEYQDRQVVALLNALSDYGRRPTQSLREIGAEMAASTRLRMTQGVAPDGSQWKALAWSTVLKRASRGRGMARGGRNVTKSGIFRKGFQARLAGTHQPLMDTRTHLFNSVTYKVERDSVFVGVAPKWAGIHQTGGRAGRGRKVTIPARPFLGVSIEDRMAIVSILSRDVLSVATTSGAE
jgi:phage gpG-like protein